MAAVCALATLAHTHRAAASNAPPGKTKDKGKLFTL
jgi:hypothetical protein